MSLALGIMGPTRSAALPSELIMSNTNNTQPALKLLLTPDRLALAARDPTILRVLARVQAPAAAVDALPRRPLHLALVLDRSGSMSGAPLQEAKRCARHIIDSLAPGDRAAIFALELDAVHVLADVRVAIEANNWVLAHQLLEVAATRFAQHAWAAAILETMKRLVAECDKSISLKESGYATRQMRGRLACVAEPMSSATDEAAVPVFLRRKGEQGKGRCDA
jgi:Ca-activated chloride channel family protein